MNGDQSREEVNFFEFAHYSISSGPVQDDHSTKPAVHPDVSLLCCKRRRLGRLDWMTRENQAYQLGRSPCGNQETGI